MTYKELHQSFLAFRREHGLEKALALIEQHGGESSLDSVPQANWKRLASAFKEPRTLDEIRVAAFAKMRRGVK